MKRTATPPLSPAPVATSPSPAASAAAPDGQPSPYSAPASSPAGEAPVLEPAVDLVVEATKRRCTDDIAGALVAFDVLGDSEYRAGKAPTVRSFIAGRLSLLQRLSDPGYLQQLAAAPGLIVDTPADLAYAEMKAEEKRAAREAAQAAVAEEQALRAEWEADLAFAHQHPAAGEGSPTFENWRAERAGRVARGELVGQERRDAQLRVAQQRTELEIARDRQRFLDANPAMKAAEEARRQRELAAQQVPALDDMTAEQLRAEVERLRGGSPPAPRAA